MAGMKEELAEFKDPELARGLIASINALAPEHANLMEVCGTHTVAIARNGIRALMPEGTKLLSGPGCPVCVTANKDIDTVIALARIPGVTIATFGDMTRVPGSTSSLLKERPPGAPSKSSIRRSMPSRWRKSSPNARSSSWAWDSKRQRRSWLSPSSAPSR